MYIKYSISVVMCSALFDTFHQLFECNEMFSDSMLKSHLVCFCTYNIDRTFENKTFVEITVR